MVRDTFKNLGEFAAQFAGVSEHFETFCIRVNIEYRLKEPSGMFQIIRAFLETVKSYFFEVFINLC